MNNDKKIELQNKIIRNLQQENSSLSERIKELEKIVDDNNQIIESAKTYHEEHLKCLTSLNEAREKYLQATQVVNEQKKKYKKEMENLLKTIRKNT